MDVEASSLTPILAHVIMKERVSVIMVNYMGFDLTSKALSSLATHAPHTEVILVDNASRDGSVERIRELFPGLTIVEMKDNKGFGSANNAGAAVASGSHLFFLNNDTIMQSDSPQHLLATFKQQKEAGVIGPRLTYADGSFQLSFGPDPSIVNEWRTKRMQRRLARRDMKLAADVQSRYHSLTRVDWVTGAALMIRREIFESIGGFDEAYFMYFEDADLCRRVRKKGFEVIYDPSTTITHHGGGSAASFERAVYVGYRRSQLRYYRIHSPFLSSFALRVYLALTFGSRLLMETLRGGNRTPAIKEVLRHVRIND